MEEIITYCDDYFLDKVYGSGIARDSPWRQLTTLLILVTAGGMGLYLSTAATNYFLFYDKRLMNHKRYIKDQIWMEISYAISQIPGMSALTCPLFLLQIHGYSLLYKNIDDYGWGYLIFSIFAFLMFVDFGIYWAHRFLHWGWVYRNIHKPHHKWLVMTPFASHSFHFLDGFIQSSPYHIAAFLFPIHQWVYFGFFFFVNIWTVSIHDGLNSLPDVLQLYINGASHHADHHLYFNYNYGQFFTLWDRLGGTHRDPKPNQYPLMDKDLDDKDIPECDRADIEITFGKKMK